MAEPADFDLIDPELRQGLAAFPEMTLAVDMLPALRERLLPPAPATAVDELVEQRLKLADGTGREVDIIVCRPVGSDLLPGLCCMHGGGFISGSAAKMASDRRHTALRLRCVLVFVDYHLAPEHPFPRALDDGYLALGWMFMSGGGFGIDPTRIAVSGISAGGGLAAALAILTRDRGEYRLAFQHLLCPMLDDRTVVERDPNPSTGKFVWTRENNGFGWRAWLGHEPGREDVSPYAAPARVTDMAGLPPAYIAVGALDLFLEENLDYARRLTRAGVAVELHVYPGVYHGAHAILDAGVSIAWERDSHAALMRALGHNRK